MTSGSWKQRRVLITGVTGFLGAWVARKLVEADAEVVGLDLEPRGCLPWHGLVDAFPIVRASVTDGDAVGSALRQHRSEMCIHLAGQSMIENADERPLEAWEVNVQGTWTVMEACRALPSLAAVVVASSNHTYGAQRTRPFTEDFPFNQLDPYGASKACADLIARTYAHSYGVPAVAVRNTNTFGGADPHLTHIVTGTILSVLAGTVPVIRSDGTPTKAYLYVEDTAEAYLLLAEHAAEARIRGEAFNVTPAEPISVLELVRAILRVAGLPDLEPTVLGEPSRERDVEHLSGERLRRTLGWEPRFSLEEGLQRTIDWYRDHRAEAGAAASSTASSGS
jgi:CDP-glucose 4,6-dehydratase